jgi:hypothetical protein
LNQTRSIEMPPGGPSVRSAAISHLVSSRITRHFARDWPFAIRFTTAATAELEGGYAVQPETAAVYPPQS